ncbi:phenylacetaldoxime dehydratase [Rhodococcus sp. 05-340-1]|uniref:phenylacetaldoxime dehydratase family protein n=1 Tax=unclassified Rhodococcus (in: high G+C Gram-positive bacteria) TaxID=192944 RepID=UPI000B9AA5F3|nr:MULTISPECIES: phenylacetaldoxime dehydratase family protein [unclassified Rhodococcus (in: high G+C Gram-positive bacteria)]OZD67510.1 phenylacetaldoxime dehydratase [Rhodococcus sp. 05-340-2]OZD76822.1 phenylacetaldoxime dehydratase [Rhodococcus sp. 05-340-1]
MSELESAIPDHLVVPRSCPRRTPEGYQPPFPSYVARFPVSTERVVMGYFGIQGLPDASPWGDEGPSRTDRARYTDEEGIDTTVFIGYWDDVAVFDRWFDSVGRHWTSVRGRFVEIIRPTVDRYETLFSSTGRMEGVATLTDSLSGTIEEHAYWGGVRDRIPLSQSDSLAPSGEPQVVRDGDRVTIVPQENLCLIRSGQDWADTAGSEREMYLRDVEPVLRAGMDFLRDDGLAIGCFANRYMTVVTDDGTDTDKSFGMSWWRSLSDLEAWAESHPTHVAIFGAALKYLSTMGPAASLRLYHEVTVAAADEQYFEYFGCHDRTGLLRTAAERSTL